MNIKLTYNKETEEAHLEYSPFDEVSGILILENTNSNGDQVEFDIFLDESLLEANLGIRYSPELDTMHDGIEV